MADKKDFFLKLLLELTRSDMLHVGYSDPDQPLSWEQVPAAQKAYEDHVLAQIPQKVENILEVGCGTGHTTVRMMRMGYQVDCLSPDAIQRQIIEEKTDDNVSFFCSKFEDFNTDKTYDLILMMESFGYIRLQDCLRQCTRYLKPGGRVLICDFFRQDPDRDYKSFHIWDQVQEELRSAGLEIEQLEDITPEVLPTVELSGRIYGRYVQPVVKTLIDSTMHSIDKKKLKKLPLKMARYLLRDKIEGFVTELDEKIPRLLDRDHFGRKMRYQLLMLKRVGDGAVGS